MVAYKQKLLDEQLEHAVTKNLLKVKERELKTCEGVLDECLPACAFKSTYILSYTLSYTYMLYGAKNNRKLYNLLNITMHRACRLGLLQGAGGGAEGGAARYHGAEEEA